MTTDCHKGISCAGVRSNSSQQKKRLFREVKVYNTKMAMLHVGNILDTASSKNTDFPLFQVSDCESDLTQINYKNELSRTSLRKNSLDMI